MPFSRFVLDWSQRFARDEQGVISVQNLFLTIAACGIGAAGLDVTHFYAARTELQVAADIAAHSALFTRYQGLDEDDARGAAIRRVRYSLPEEPYGEVISDDDIVFGDWDPEDDKFTPLDENDTGMPSAVQVITHRVGNDSVGSFLFRIVGIDEMDVRASAVYTVSGDPCTSLQGLFGNKKVWPKSGNTFGAGICVHSQTEAAVQSDPTFAEGSHISAPNIANVTCQGNKCESFEDARRRGSYDVSQYYNPLQGGTTRSEMLSQVQHVMELMPHWSGGDIANMTPYDVPVTGRAITLTGSPSMSNQVQYVNCGGSELTLSGTFSGTVLLLNDCKVKAKDTLTLSDAILYNTNTDNKTAFNFGSGAKAAKLVVGNDMDCDGTGAAYILTRGGFDAPAKMTLNNGTVIARSNVTFAAQFGGADAHARGMSVIAGGEITTTSESTFAACPPDSQVGEAGPVSFRLAL